MNHLVFIFCLSLVFITKEASAQYYNTSNGCFYTQSRTIIGTQITSLPVQGTTTDQLISTCCDFCRGLPGCVAWQYTANTCYFYRDIISFGTANANYFIGKNSGSPFWFCDIEENKWYYESRLWTLQGTTVTRELCCQNCFFKWNTCKSWMHNVNTNDCYHSTINHQNSNNVFFNGMFTGNVNLIL